MYSGWGPPPINVRKSITVVGRGRFIDRVQAGLLRDLLEGLVCRALPERVERLLARGLLRVGDVCWGLGVSAASPMASATASSPGVLIRWWLARLRVVGVTPSLELGAVAFDVPGCLAVVTGGRLIARIGMCGAGGDVIAAVGASVVADPVALLAWVVRGPGPPPWGAGALPSIWLTLTLIGSTADCAEGMDTVFCPQEAGCWWGRAASHAGRLGVGTAGA